MWSCIRARWAMRISDELNWFEKGLCRVAEPFFCVKGTVFSGMGVRIATAVNRSLVRNDTVNKKCRGRRDTWVPPYGTVCRGGRPCPPGPDNATPCRAGPVCPAVGAGKIRVGPSGKSAKRCQWQMKRAGFEEVPRLADTTVTGNRLARRWATAGPYGSVTRGAMGGRPQGSPLRMGCKRCGGQATTRVAPTVGIIWGHEVFLFSCKFILEKQLGICYTLHYSGNKFLSA